MRDIDGVGGWLLRVLEHSKHLCSRSEGVEEESLGVCDFKYRGRAVVPGYRHRCPLVEWSRQGKQDVLQWVDRDTALSSVSWYASPAIWS